jgi:hypothetical protein
MYRFPNVLSRSAGLLLAAAHVSACVIPVPVRTGFESGSRDNLGDGVPAFLTAGKTTREEVLLSFGQADEAAQDGSWLVYRASLRTGGVVVILYPSPAVPATEDFEYRQLIVFFNASGVVERTQFEKAYCHSREWITQGASPAPKRQCVDPAGNELPSYGFPLRHP